MPKKYLYMQNGSDKFKPLPPIYGKVPLRYRDRHHIINGDVYDCTGNDLLTSIDPLGDNSLVAKFRLDGNFTNIAPGSNNITLSPVDSTRVYFDKSGPFNSKALNFFPMDLTTLSNNMVISNYIANTVFKDGLTVSMFIKLNSQFNLNSLLDSSVSTTANSNKFTEIFRITTDISSDIFSAENTIRNPALYFSNIDGTIFTDRSVKYNILNNQSTPTYLANKTCSISNYSDKWIHLVYTADNYNEKLIIDGEVIFDNASTKGEFKDIVGYFTLGSLKLSNNISYKQVELFNKKINDVEAITLLNQKARVFAKDPSVVYYEENQKLMYLNTDEDGNILSKGFEDKIGYNGQDKNLISLDENGKLVDSYGNNPLAGKVNRILQNTSYTLANITGAGWVPYNTYEFDMDTDEYDYIIVLTNNVKVYGVPINNTDKGAQINVSLNGTSIVTNSPLCYNNASNLVSAANNNSFANVTTISPKITNSFKGKFKLEASIAKYALTAGLNDTTWGVQTSTWSNDSNYAQGRTHTSDKSDFIIYEIHKDNNKRY